jgi:hypothetical protein
MVEKYWNNCKIAAAATAWPHANQAGIVGPGAFLGNIGLQSGPNVCCRKGSV